MSFARSLREAVKPLAKRVLFGTLRPVGPMRPLFAAASHAGFYARETFEWGRRALVATPAFLAICESYGENISIDRVPYVNGTPRIQLGSNIRVSGQLGISASSRGEPLLKIEDGVFIGNGTSIAVANRVTIGRFASIGSDCYIADTEGHSHYNPQRPIWEVPASDDDIAPVTIEEGVQISKHCMILKGVTIGARSVIGAGSVIRSDIPPDSVVMGNPARVVKRMTPT